MISQVTGLWYVDGGQNQDSRRINTSPTRHKKETDIRNTDQHKEAALHPCRAILEETDLCEN